MPDLSNRWGWLAGLAIGCALIATQPVAAQTVRFIDATPERVGLTLPQDTGLPEALWQGSSPSRLAAVLDGLPAEVQSPAQYRALVNLLRVSAAPPDGEQAMPSLASRRLAALARLGAEQDVLDLAERIDPGLRDAPYWQARATVAMLRYNLSGVCALPTQAGDAAATEQWQRLAAFCRLLRKQEEAAMVAVMLADELGGDDPVFTQLFLSRQFPERPAGPAVTPTEPLHLTMIRALSQPMALPKMWNETPALVASSVARYPAIGLEPRTEAAERAVRANVLPADMLVQLYLATELTTPLGATYRQVAITGSGPQRLAALEAFWDATAKAGLYAQLAPFSLEFMTGLDLKAVPPAFAARALRAALAARDAAATGAAQNALATAGKTQVGAEARDAAYLILALAGEPLPASVDWWPAWLKAAKPGEEKTALAAGLLQALGIAVPNASGPGPDRSASARAIARAEAGEAALLALTALAASPAPSAGLTVQAVAALAKVSPADARTVAVELAIAAGL